MTTNRSRGPIPPSRPRTAQPAPAGDGKALADAIAAQITAGIMPALNLEGQTMTDKTDKSGYADGGPIPPRPKSISTEATAVREAAIAQARAEGRADALQIEGGSAKPSLADEIAALEGADAIDDELAQMKRALGKPGDTTTGKEG